jgi:hypothetical protein
VLTDPLPDELADLTSDQVDAYNAAWAACDDDLTDGWSADQDTVDALRLCLAGELGISGNNPQDPHLLAFVDWLVLNEDAANE